MQSQITGLADGDNTSANRLIYGDTQINDCDTASLVWNQSGSLWVR